MPYYKHKGVRHSKKKPHKHPSHPYPHPSGRWHRYPPTSRIPDRKGKKFRQTPQERKHTHVKSKISSKRGKKKRWD